MIAFHQHKEERNVGSSPHAIAIEVESKRKLELKLIARFEALGEIFKAPSNIGHITQKLKI